MTRTVIYFLMGILGWCAAVYFTWYQDFGVKFYIPGAKLKPKLEHVTNIPVLHVKNLYFSRSKETIRVPIFILNDVKIEPYALGVNDLSNNFNNDPKFIYELSYYRMNGNKILIDKASYKDSSSNYYNFVNIYSRNRSEGSLAKLNEVMSSRRLTAYFLLFALFIGIFSETQKKYKSKAKTI